jgi:tRNA uracil 4-sulfurtransferase
MADDRQLLLAPAGEIYLKSKPTRRRFRRFLRENLRAALSNAAPGVSVRDDERRLVVAGPADQLEAAADAARRVFGLKRVSLVRVLSEGSLPDMVEAVAQVVEPRVTGRTFAVRVRRRGGQPWRTMQAERDIGTRLLAASGGVDLDNPEVEVRVEAFGDTIHVVERSWDGAGGVPLRTQDGALCLLSGGFDSAVAAWMVMRRGVPLHFVHFKLECAQSDHALAVAHELVRRWGAGTSPLAWVVDFGPARAELLERVPSRVRQVVLKQLMVAAADRLAQHTGRAALVTGESIGQVSSQTLAHLAAIDRSASRSVLRPLAGMDKEEIVAASRHIGTHDLSARAKEVCNLSPGKVAVGAGFAELDSASAHLTSTLVDEAVDGAAAIALTAWMPGMDPVPVVPVAPEGVPTFGAGDPLPESGPVAVAGRGAATLATRLRSQGREAFLVRP